MGFSWCSQISKKKPMLFFGKKLFSSLFLIFPQIVRKCVLFQKKTWTPCPFIFHNFRHRQDYILHSVFAGSVWIICYLYIFTSVFQNLSWSIGNFPTANKEYTTVLMCVLQYLLYIIWYQNLCAPSYAKDKRKRKLQNFIFKFPSS